MKTKQFNQRQFEGEEDTLFTFKGHNNSFCIMLNAKCIHSTKTKSLHEKKLTELILSRNLIETTDF